MNILTLILIGISLSIDAFGMALAYGLVGIKKKNMILSSIMVGLFHFFMPLIGFLIGSKLLDTFKINSKYLIIMVIILLIIEMIKSLNEKEKELNTNIFGMLSFAFLVSIDSFTVGIGINYITNTPIYASIIFASISGTFTLLGFILGKTVSSKFEKISKYIGLAILVILLIYFLF